MQRVFCAPSPSVLRTAVSSGRKQSMTDFAEALRKAEAWIDEIEGVEGVAQGRTGEDDCITVFVSMAEAAEKIPSSFHGYKVAIEYSGDFHAQL